MLKSRYVAVLLVAVFLTCFGAMASTLTKIQTSGDPTYPTGGRFYGYVSSSTGPGDQAFAKILDLVSCIGADDELWIVSQRVLQRKCERDRSESLYGCV